MPFKPNVGPDVVQFLRVADVMTPLKTLEPPSDPSVQAELIALAYAHEDAKVRKKAKQVASSIDGLAKIGTAFRTLVRNNDVADEALAELSHELTAEIACAMVFHAGIGSGAAFEGNAEIRALFLEQFVTWSKERERDSLWLHRGMEPCEEPRFHNLTDDALADIFEAATSNGFAGLSFKNQVRSLTLPASFGEASSWLTYLEMSGTVFTTLPESILALDKLETLRMWAHSLEDLPDLSSMASLKTLNLSWPRKMKVLPNSVCEHPGIEQLEVGVGKMKIPPAISKMESLRVLDVERAKIKSLPKTLVDCPKLEKLVIKGCRNLDPTALKAMFDAAGKDVEIVTS